MRAMKIVAGLGRVTNAVGIGLICLGASSALLPAFTGAPVVILVGIVLLLAGAARAWFGWHAWSEGMGPLGVVLGGLAAMCGLAIVANPVSTLETVASLVAAYMVLDGVSSLGLLRGVRDENGRASVWADGVLSILLGVSMWMGWPLSGMRALGVLLGAKLASAGAVVLRVGRGITRVGERAAGLRARLDR